MIICVYIYNYEERKVVSFHTEGDNQFEKIIIFSDLLIVLTGHVALYFLRVGNLI